MTHPTTVAGTLNIPGFAVLCRVAYPAPRAAGAGYFCALAVPAKSEAEARSKAALFLDPQDDEVLTVEDTRALTDAESDGLTTIRRLGQKVHFEADTDT